jgi:hypothetical protein
LSVAGVARGLRPARHDRRPRAKLAAVSKNEPTPTLPEDPEHAVAEPAPPTARELYYEHFGDRRRERQLISTATFFATFAAVRAITHAIRAERGPFRNITPGGRHIHHMTFGITGLISVGYLWLLEIGTDDRRQASRITSAVYGAGAALTLDEFALWLNLEDDYWNAKGRESIDAVVLFGSLLVLGALGKGFVADLFKRRR